MQRIEARNFGMLNDEQKPANRRALASFQARSSLKDTITHTLTYVIEGNKGRRMKYLIQDYGDARRRKQKAGDWSTSYNKIF